MRRALEKVQAEDRRINLAWTVSHDARHKIQLSGCAGTGKADDCAHGGKPLRRRKAAGHQLSFLACGRGRCRQRRHNYHHGGRAAGGRSAGAASRTSAERRVLATSAPWR